MLPAICAHLDFFNGVTAIEGDAFHGFPARVIVPGIYGMKNVKWLTGLELVNYDYKGHWQQQSWSDEALVKLSSRIDLPGDRETITTSTLLGSPPASSSRL